MLVGMEAPAADEANEGMVKAIAALREAEAAGATEGELKPLVEELNSALQMIGEAERLSAAGDAVGSAAQAERSIEISSRIVSQAARLRDEASVRAYYGRVYTYVMVPVASILVTAGAHYGFRFWQRRDVERTMRMVIKAVKEQEE